MKIVASSTLVVLASVLLTSCGGGGSNGGSPSITSPACFIFTTIPNSSASSPSTLYRATTDDPSHPVALHAAPNNNEGFYGATIDPKTLKVYYGDPADQTQIRVVNWDGTGDQLFFTDPNVRGMGGGGFLPDGNVVISMLQDGDYVSVEINLTTKAITQLPKVAGMQYPPTRYWNRDRSAFAYWFTPDTYDMQVWKMNVTTGTKSLIADQVFGGQYAPDNTVLGPDFSGNRTALDRFNENGLLLARYQTQRLFDHFFQVGTIGFLENGMSGPAGDTNITYYKFDGSPSINMTPTISDQVDLWDAVQMPSP
jgi:hypothetical protein